VSGKATKNLSAGAKCETCGKRLEYRGIGRPRRFCGPDCYAVAHNERRRRVSPFIYVDGRIVENPDPRPKRKGW
jgi:hypothetical protein